MVGSTAQSVVSTHLRRAAEQGLGVDAMAAATPLVVRTCILSNSSLPVTERIPYAGSSLIFRSLLIQTLFIQRQLKRSGYLPTQASSPTRAPSRSRGAADNVNGARNPPAGVLRDAATERRRMRAIGMAARLFYEHTGTPFRFLERVSRHSGSLHAVRNTTKLTLLNLRSNSQTRLAWPETKRFLAIRSPPDLRQSPTFLQVPSSPFCANSTNLVSRQMTPNPASPCTKRMPRLSHFIARARDPIVHVHS